MLNPFKKKEIVRDNSTVQKNFSFQKNNVNLAFTLRVDTKQELTDFAELLKVATLEVDKELRK